MPLLEVRNLDISFKNGEERTSVVSGLELSLKEGGFFGLAGESGSGKSLTALSLLGILPPGATARGHLNFKGKDLLALSGEEMRRIRGREISMVFQEPMTSLNPVLRIGYQIREAIQAHKEVSREEADAQVIELLRSVKIPLPEIRMRDYPHQLSGGMRQRVMIAMAISCNPALLIADEPTTALDVTIEAQILELLENLRTERKMAVLLITHDLGIIAEYAENVGVMYAGRIVETASVREIFDNPRHPYTIGLLESLPRRRGEALRPIPGTVPPPWALPPGCKFSDRCRYMIPACQEAEPDLLQAGGGHLARCIRMGDIHWKP